MTDKATLLLEKLNTNILVTGRTGTSKSTYLKSLNIPDSKYLDFPELTKEKRHKSWEESCSLTDSNFNDFNLSKLKESTLILDSVEFSEDLFNSPLVQFILGSKSLGKRLIIVAFPENAKRAEYLFDAIIEMGKDENGYTRRVRFKNETELQE